MTMAPGRSEVTWIDLTVVFVDCVPRPLWGLTSLMALDVDVDLAEILAKWEPHDVRLKLSVTRSFAIALEQVCADLRLSKSLVLREAVRRGLPALVNDVVYLRSQGYRSGAHLTGRLALTGKAWTKGRGRSRPAGRSARATCRRSGDAPAFGEDD